MERETIQREGSPVTLRIPAAAHLPGRLLDAYPGTPQHGAGRRDVQRIRPRGEDLLAAE